MILLDFLWGSDPGKKTYHGEDGGEDADLLRLRRDVVVPVVVGGEEVEHELRGLLVLGFAHVVVSFLGGLKGLPSGS